MISPLNTLLINNVRFPYTRYPHNTLLINNVRFPYTRYPHNTLLINNVRFPYTRYPQNTLIINNVRHHNEQTKPILTFSISEMLLLYFAGFPQTTTALEFFRWLDSFSEVLMKTTLLSKFVPSIPGFQQSLGKCYVQYPTTKPRRYMDPPAPQIRLSVSVGSLHWIS